MNFKFARSRSCGWHIAQLRAQHVPRGHSITQLGPRPNAAFHRCSTCGAVEIYKLYKYLQTCESNLAKHSRFIKCKMRFVDIELSVKYCIVDKIKLWAWIYQLSSLSTCNFCYNSLVVLRSPKTHGIEISLCIVDFYRYLYLTLSSIGLVISQEDGYEAGRWGVVKIWRLKHCLRETLWLPSNVFKAE